MSDLDQLRDDFMNYVVELQNRVGYLESELRSVRDLAQNADYMASDAKSAADNAQREAQRGW
jgi:hypothetical protein